MYIAPAVCVVVGVTKGSSSITLEARRGRGLGLALQPLPSFCKPCLCPEGLEQLGTCTCMQREALPQLLQKEI